jgi:hypothetical protein
MNCFKGLIACLLVVWGCNPIPTSSTPSTISFDQTTDTVSHGNGLILTLAIDSTAIHPGDSVSVTIDERNTLSTENKVDSASAWPVKGLALGPCPYEDPLGIAILKGNYNSSSVSTVTPLLLWAPGEYHCPAYLLITGFEFQPLSDSCIYEGGSVPSPTSVKVRIAFAGFWTENPNSTGNPFLVSGTFSNFTPGVYTVVGGDEWGALVILHFTVL